MPQISPHASVLRQIRPSQFRLEHLLVYWVLAILLPAAAIFGLLNYSEHLNYQANKTRVIDSMLETYENLQNACSHSEYFASMVKLAEQNAGLPQRDTSLIPDVSSLKDIPEHLHRSLNRLRHHDLLLLITSESDLKSTRVFTNPSQASDYPKPGNRAAREIMHEYRSLNSSVVGPVKQSAGNRKILKSFATSIFGIYFDPLAINEDFAVGFSEKFGGSRILSARRLVKSANGRPLFSFIALFRETGSPLEQSFALAKRQLAESGFSFRLKMLPAIPFPFVFENSDGSLRLTGPVQIGLLMAGFFNNKDIMSSLISRGIMEHRPAIFPHIELKADAIMVADNQKTIRPGFVIFLFLCLSLLLIKSFHQQNNLLVSIRTRLFLSVLLATALPATTFIFYLHRHVTRDFTRRQNQMSQKLKSHLKLLELAVKSADQAHFDKFQEAITRIKEIACTADEATLKKQLDIRLDKSFSGVSLLRNDGIIVEKLDYDKVNIEKIEKKLNTTREFTYASIIRFFQYMGLMPEAFRNKLMTSSRGKKLLAMAEIFEPMDVDNFCSYEGQSQTSKQDFANYRLLNYKILPPPTSNEKHGAVLLLIQDIRELAHLIVDEFANTWSFFRQESEEGLMETFIISSFNLESTSLDLNHVWPAGPLQQRQLDVAQRLTHKRSEAEIIFTEADGTLIIVTGRKISGYPLIAISECRMAKLAQDKSMVFAVICLNLIYILLLLRMLVSILSELFMPPISQLLNAARLTGKGASVHIKNSFNNELSQLTGEFNTMNRQIKERDKLERFISREAIQTIASESRDNIDIASQKVTRTIVFFHIRDFNKLSASLGPEELFSMLNLFFPFVEEKIDAAGGQIDKYIGDAIMAVFADRSEQTENAATRACRAVSLVFKKLAELNGSLTENNLPGIKIGVGISTGMVISGRIGSYQGRLDYTVIGDRVNLAARLEAASHFGETGHILIDEITWETVSSFFSCRLHGEIAIKGKNLPVKTYEIIA